MSKQAPRIDRRIVGALRRLDDPALPIAETSRRVGQLAVELGLPRPSYEQIRVLVHAERRRTELRRARMRRLQRVYVGRLPPRALLEDDG